MKIKCFYNNIKSMYLYKKGKTILPPPSFIWIEPTNHCNLNCIMCPNSVIKKDKKGFMDFELYKKIIDDIKDYVSGCYLFLSGESLLHKNIFDMIKYAKGKGIKVLLHTNGTLIDKDMSQKILKSDLDYILFSFDGFSKEIYEKIRVNANYEKTLENIKGFLNMRKGKKPYTVIQNIIIDSIIDKDKFRFGISSFYKKFDKLPDDIIIKLPDNFSCKELKNKINFSTIKLGENYNPCSMIWGSISILWDGTVVPCCQDFIGEINLGNIKEERLINIWNGKKMLNLRKTMLNKTPPKKCQKCFYLYDKKILGLPSGLWKIFGASIVNSTSYKLERLMVRLSGKQNLQYMIFKGANYKRIEKSLKDFLKI